MPVLDHFGFVVHSLEAAADVFAKLAGARVLGEAVDDPHHGCRILFMGTEEGAPRIELIEPLDKASPQALFADRGGGIHHVCYQVASLDTLAEWCKATGFKKVMGPNPAPAFGPGRRVAFVHAPGLGLVEFVETAGAVAFGDFSDFSARPLLTSFMAWKKQ